MKLIKCLHHHHFMQIKTLTIILAITFVTKVSCQDQNTLQLPVPSPADAVAGQLCISECGTCPVICSSSPPPSPSTDLTPLPPPSPRSPPQPPPSPPPETIEPLLPPPTKLPPLLPIPPPPGGNTPPPSPKVSHPPPPPPSSSSGGSPKSSSGGSSSHSPPSSPPVSFPLVINPAGPSPPYPYYYFYESSAAFSSLPLTVYFSVIVIFAFNVHVFTFYDDFI